jgi:dihydroxyacetone kinase phosphotransfer subunit
VVGLVLVSHSAALAQEVAVLVHGLGFDQVSVQPAGGTADGRMGTSVDVVVAAMRRADDGDGVVVLADLGSAVLTAKLALEEADDGAHDEAGGGDAGTRVRLADAPLVEGAVAAAGAVAAGGDLDAVAQAADSARDYRKL